VKLSQLERQPVAPDYHESYTVEDGKKRRKAKWGLINAKKSGQIDQIGTLSEHISN
jgi:hypothetical protein